LPPCPVNKDYFKLVDIISTSTGAYIYRTH
jgi:hypothetical protein